ncbi:DNA polymerase delta subunit 4, partial [Mucuna pruriens]
MASVSGNMKGFYRQKKNVQKSSKKSPAISHDGKPDLEDEQKESEAVLRQFDLNMAYGPCLGMTRLARWERAQKLGLNPPPEIESLLKSGNVQTESLWDGLEEIPKDLIFR